ESDAAGGDAVAAVGEGAHRDLEAVADLTEEGLRGNLDLVEGDLGRVRGAQAELAVDLLGAEAIARGGDEEAAEATLLKLRFGLGEDQRDRGVIAEGEPHLLAGDRPPAGGAGGAG